MKGNLRDSRSPGPHWPFAGEAFCDLPVASNLHGAPVVIKVVAPSELWAHFSPQPQVPSQSLIKPMFFCPFCGMFMSRWYKLYNSVSSKQVDRTFIYHWLNIFLLSIFRDLL